MRSRVFFASFFVLVLVALIAAPRSAAQAVYGGIAGSVTDAQGNAVAGAKVTVTNIGKGTTEETSTNESGLYTVSHLIADEYKIRIEATGFKAYEVPNIRVSADTVVRADAAMQVGDITQSIEVTGEIPQLQTEKTDVSTVFQSRTIEDLPIYNRNFTTFQLLSPGNQRLGWGHAASENPQGSQQILTQGQHFAGTGFELDGTDNQDPILGIIVINPNLEAINEVKITAQDYDAEFGKAIGAIVTSQTKSGTNEIHGTLFDFQRSNSNFARNPFTQSPAAGVPSGNWNQFGAAVGGPIKKNSLFWFGDYQGQRSHVGGSAGTRVPTAAERAGDFSDIGVPIFDPYLTDATHSTLVLDGNGQPIPLASAARTPFPNNIIPASRLSPQTLALLSLIPVGADVTPATSSQNNFFGSGNNTLDSDAFDVRIDHATTTKLSIFGRYSFQQFTRSGPGLFGTLVGGPALPSDPSVGSFAGNSSTRNQSIATGFNYTFSPTLLTDFRFGYMRYRVQVTPGGLGTSPATDAGIPGLNLDDFFTSAMPSFQIHIPGGAPDFNFGYSLNANQCNCPLNEQEHQYQFVNNWTNVRGNHSIKFGADVRYAYNLRVPSDAHRAGQLEFNNDMTQGPGGTGGIGLAGFLLGNVSHFNRYVSNSTNAYETQPRLFFYGQDTWRITPKLTFNFGLRWEMYFPERVPRDGGGGWLDPATGEMRVAGLNGVDRRGNTDTDFKHFAPRLGIAYQWNPKTVLRIGYGRSYDIGVFGSVFGHSTTQNLPVLGQQDYTGGSAGSQDFNTAFFLSNGPQPFDPATKLTTNNCNIITDPSLTQTTCLGPNGRPMLPDGVFSRIRPFNNRLPSVDAWNVSLQRQLTPTLTATIAYVGNKGTHTFADDSPAYNINGRTNNGYDPNAADPAQNRNQRRPFYGSSAAFPFPTLAPYGGNFGWTQDIDYFGNDANNTYNSLQLSAEKRFSGGLSFQSSYTFQHANEYDSNGYNIYKEINYGPNPNYRNHVFIFTQVWDLPLGQGKKWASGVGRAADLIIGGWSINSSTNFSSGLPFTPNLSSCSPEIDAGPCIADRVGGVQDGSRSGDPKVGGYWFQGTGGSKLNADVCGGETPLTSGPWGQPGCNEFGNGGRNSMRGPKFFNTDFSVFKSFKFTERIGTQFQFTVYNVFNHVNLNLPNSNVDDAGAGSISDITFGSTMRRLQFGLKLNF